jgi:hypothetical protein
VIGETVLDELTAKDLKQFTPDQCTFIGGLPVDTLLISSTSCYCLSGFPIVNARLVLVYRNIVFTCVWFSFEKKHNQDMAAHCTIIYMKIYVGESRVSLGNPTI